MTFKKLAVGILFNTLLVVVSLIASIFLMFVSILGPKLWPIAESITSNPDGQYWLKGLCQAMPNLLTTAWIGLLFVKTKQLPVWSSMLIFFPVIGIELSVAISPDISEISKLGIYISTIAVLMWLILIFSSRFRTIRFGKR